MKDAVSTLVDEKIKDLNVFVFDAFTSTEEGKKIFNIVLDSSEVIDLNKITEASRIINVRRYWWIRHLFKRERRDRKWIVRNLKKH